MKKLVVIGIVILIGYKTVRGQQYLENDVGFNFGLVLALGNKIDRIGVSFNTFYVNNKIQVNNELRCYFNLKSLGPKGKSTELVASMGLVYGYGTSATDSNFLFHPVSNQTAYANSVGYAYNFYLNTNNTSQQTGTLAFEFDNVSVIAENDLFARAKLDRFRTGAFLVKYHRKDFAIGANATLFTGLMGQKINDPNYPHSGRYKSSKNGIYSTTSHGLLSLQAEYVTPYYQRMQGNIGIDAEQVRHAIQNRFIHDLIFLPKPWRRENSAHIPMLDALGNQYLFRKDQKIKPAELYINGYLNPALFY